MKILTILGARPQFVKAASMSRAIVQAQGLSEVIVHTGQHFDKNMSQVFFDEMQIPSPDYNLSVSGGSHSEMTGKMMIKLDEVVAGEKPDLVLVYGDTNSTLAGGLVASKLHIPIVHVEAGLRSFNNKMPEELNRIIVDRISSILCCPSEEAAKNLKSEGVPDERIFVVGDIMYDSVTFYSEQNSNLEPSVWKSKTFALATFHRAENVRDPQKLGNLLDGLARVSEELEIVCPLHPGTLENIKKFGLTIPKNIQIIEPVGYLEMLDLISCSSMVLTDSGGLQKEAYFLQKPCITLREETEWVETIQSGCNVLVGTDPAAILREFHNMRSGSCDFSQNLYGDGTTAHQICKVLQDFKV